ncbi:hypothetical protein GCM10009802_68250 [Streptomyces synnematoformans]|uniref:Uncharacterized protein n=1 Tax=Streptomyces synnematoformans TaxID=415721 RepID=A0ABN2AJS7_9ACTN
MPAVVQQPETGSPVAGYGSDAGTGGRVGGGRCGRLSHGGKPPWDHASHAVELLTTVRV